MTAEERGKAITGYQAAQLLEKQIADIEALYKQGPGGTKGLAGLRDYLPTEANQRFNAAGNAPRGSVGQALGFTGGQLNSVQEAEMAIGPYLPKAGDRDSVIQDKIERLKDIANQAKARSTAQLGGVPNERGEIVPVAPSATASAGGDGIDRSATPDLSGLPDRPGGQTTLAAPTSQLQSSVTFPGLNARVAGIIRGGGSVQDVVSAMAAAGNRPDPATIDAIQKNIEAVQRGYKGPLSIDAERSMVPITGWQSIANPLAQSPVGTAAITAGDAVTGFNLARLTPNANQTRAGIAGLSTLNPKSALAGNIAGGVLTGMGGEAALGLAGLGRGAGALSPRLLASDAAYGGLSGYGIGGDNAGIADVAGGALLGAGAGAATRGAIGGIAGTVGPTGGAAAPLYREGVRPTPGQRFANAGMFGRALNTGEQALQSVPFVGSMVSGARQGARDQFESGAFNRALREIGTELPQNAPYGPDAFAYSREAFGNVYDRARSGMRFTPDGQFAADAGNFQRDILRSGILDADGQRQVESIISGTVGSRLSKAGGQLDGDVYKKTISDLRKRASSVGKPEVRDAVRSYADILEAGARRQSDPAAVSLLDAADRGYAQYAPLKEAARMAGNEGSRFTPKNLESVERRSMGKTNAFLEGNTLMGDYIQAGRSLTDTLPNSGTADRMLAVGGLGGAGFINPALPLGAVAATIPYAPGIRRATAGLLAPTESPLRLRIADDLLRYQPAIGLLGAPLALEASR